MSKKMLVIALTFVMSLSTLFGCFGGEDAAPRIDRMSIDGEEVLLRMGDVAYTADDLFGDMLNTKEGAEQAFEQVLRVLVNQIVPRSHPFVVFQVDSQYDEFVQRVKEEAEQRGVDYQELIDVSLAEEGYESIEEFKNDLAINFQLELAKRDFWDEHKEEYFLGHIQDRLQFYLRHILVSVPSGNNTDLFFTNISSNNARALYDVFKLIEGGSTFSSAANILSDDPGSAEKGGAYKMDITTEFVNEFRIGVVAFDAFSRGVNFGDIKGISPEMAVEMERIYGSGFNAIPASYFHEIYERRDDTRLLTDTEMTGHPFSVTDRNNITIPRNVIFNSVFNNSGISMIYYDLEVEGDYPENTCEFDFVKGEGGVPETRRVLCDQDGNPIFMTRGSHGVHFLVIEHSPFDLEETANFFSFDRNAEHETYINLFNPSVSERNQRLQELEQLAENYAHRGIPGCVTCPLNEMFLYFDMFDHFLEVVSNEFDDFEISPILEDVINNLIQVYRDDSVLGFELKISRYVESYVSKIDKANSDFVSRLRVPTACLLHESGENVICGFSSEDGFHIIEEGGE